MKRLLAAVGVMAALVWLAGTAFGATGGPDAGGYRFIDSNETFGPTFAYQDISGTGTNIGNSCDDCTTDGVSIGFTFNFYGTNYTTVNISSNGNLQFDTNSASLSNGAIPTGAFGHAILPFWDDLITFCDGADEIFVRTSGAPGSRQFIVQWRMIGGFVSCGVSRPDADFELILFEGTNEVLVQYRDTIFGGSQSGRDNGMSATAGVQGSSSIGLQYSFNTAALVNGLAICYRPLTAPPNVVCGRTIATNTPTPTATATATPLSDATRVRANTGGAVGAIGAAAADQARENRERAAAPAVPQATVVPPNTGTGITPAIRPPNTGDAGLADHSAFPLAPLVLLASTLGGAILMKFTARR